ncbi:MAG: hypothetical protein M0T72_12865 [Candidatus Dormibacteraeota bacterium]|nr:hypothetical protein [Candidatus Dormibacteraeota bacterium]
MAGWQDPLAQFVPWLGARPTDRAHIWDTILFDYVLELGYGAAISASSVS